MAFQKNFHVANMLPSLVVAAVSMSLF